MKYLSLLILASLFISPAAYALDYEDYIKFSEMEPTVENGIDICLEQSDRSPDTCRKVKSFAQGGLFNWRPLCRYLF